MKSKRTKNNRLVSYIILDNANPQPDENKNARIERIRKRHEANIVTSPSTPSELPTRAPLNEQPIIVTPPPTHPVTYVPTYVPVPIAVPIPFYYNVNAQPPQVHQNNRESIEMPQVELQVELDQKYPNY